MAGNDAYTEQSRLRNAVNDARAVASALREVGFTVMIEENAPRARLVELLGAFGGSLRADDVALFYFAGHGVRVEQVNYLLPTDYAGWPAADLCVRALSAVRASSTLRRAGAGAATAPPRDGRGCNGVTAGARPSPSGCQAPAIRRRSRSGPGRG